MGRDRSGLYEPAVQEYASRLAHYTRFELLELPEAGGKKGKAADAKALEAEAILARRKPQDWLVALQVALELLRGSVLSSRTIMLRVVLVLVVRHLLHRLEVHLRHR